MLTGLKSGGHWMGLMVVLYANLMMLNNLFADLMKSSSSKSSSYQDPKELSFHNVWTHGGV